MLNLLPAGTTWLDIATLAVALVALLLTLRKDRRENLRRMSVAISMLKPGDPSDHTLAVLFTNTGKQPLSVTGAGFASRKGDELLPYARWHTRNHRSTGKGPWAFTSDPAFPEPLQPGGVPYAVKADIRRVKSEVFPQVPAWVWAVDEQDKVWWCRIPDEVQAAHRAATRYAQGPDDEYGHPIEMEVNDHGEAVTPP